MNRIFIIAAAFLAVTAAVAARAETAPPPPGITFALPKDWGVVRSAAMPADMVGAAVATGLIDVRPDVRVFTAKTALGAPPAQWREWIVMRGYPHTAGLAPGDLDNTLLGDLEKTCATSKRVTIKSKVPEPAVIAGGYHLCAQMTSHPYSQVVLYKVVDGPERTYLLTRHRRAGPLPADQLTDLAKSFPAKMGHWMKWYASIRLRSPDALLKKGTGTAFALSSRLLLTNDHVLKNCREVRIAGDGLVSIKVRDQANDLALLETPQPMAAHARLGIDAETRLGMPVMVAGYPLGDALGNSLSVTTGTINGHGGLKGKEGLVRFDAAVQKGNSGGPLLGQSGNVIGVVRGILDPSKAQNVNFAITLPVIEAFLTKHAIAYEKGAPGAPLSPPDLAEMAKAFTVQVECWR